MAASDVSKTVLRGLSIPAGVSLSASTSVTQAGPEPGPALDTSTVQSDMVLSGAGVQDDTTYDILALRGGFPGVAGRGAFAWKMSTDADDEYRGHEPPVVVTGTEPASTLPATSVQCTALSDGQSYIEARTFDQLGTGVYYNIDFRTRLADGSETGQVIFLREIQVATHYPPEPCTVEVPGPNGGRRVLGFFLVAEIAANTAQIRMYYSDDDGATWTLGESEVLLEALDTTPTPGAGNPGHVPRRLRAAYKDGQVLLVASAIQSDTTPGFSDVFIQWASDDGGVSFALVDIWSGVTSAADDHSGRYHDLVVAGGYFRMYYIDSKGDGGQPLVPVQRKVASAQSPLGDVLPSYLGISTVTRAWATASGTPQVISDGDLAAWKTDDGVIYIAGRLASVSVQFYGVVVKSVDGGDTFDWIGESLNVAYAGTLWAGSAGNIAYMQGISACQQGGRSVMVGFCKTAAALFDTYPRRLFLGGYTQVTLPGLDDTGGDLKRVSWSTTFFPWTTAALQGWTTTGAGTETPAVEYTTIVTTANTRYNDLIPAGTVAEGLIAQFHVAEVGGGVLFAANIAARFVLDDGAQDFDLTFRFSAIGIRLVDNNAASLGDVAIDVTAGVEVLIAMADSSVRVWYRAATTAPDDREWVLGWTSDTLADGGGGGAGGTNLVRWGNIAVAAATSRWYRVQASAGPFAGLNLIDFVNPTSLAGRRFNSRPVFVADGTLLQTKDGPALAGQTWTMPPVYQYPKEAIDPQAHPSPRVKWRSTSEAAQTIAWAVSDDTADGYLEGTTLVLNIRNANWRTASLRGVTAAAAVTVLASVDLATGMTGLSYDRVSDRVAPRAGTTLSAEWLQTDELVGGTAALGGGKLRHIARSKAGIWTDAAGIQTALFLEDVDETEAANGNIDVWSPNGVVIVHGVTGPYKTIELVIAAQTTADGYIEAGIISLEILNPFACQYGRGRTQGFESNTELTELDSGARYAYNRGPSRRTARWAWRSPIDTRALFEAAPTPDYVSGKATYPLAAPADTHYTLEGVVDRVDGLAVPVTYIPRIPRAPSDVYHLLRKRQSSYGRIGNTLAFEAVLGDEGENETWRIQTVTHSEEV